MLLTYEAVSNILNRADSYFENYSKAIENMASVVFYDDQLEALIEHTFDTPRTPKDKSRLSNDYLYETIHHNFKMGRETYGKTSWEAYNAICEYIDHQKPIANSMETAGSKDNDIVSIRQHTSLLVPSKIGGNVLRNKAFDFLTSNIEGA